MITDVVARPLEAPTTLARYRDYIHNDLSPTLGPIRTPPFSAIRLQVGDIAASAGLVTDADARVLADDEPIPGLFAIGNEMQSVMGNAYPGPGINLGPAIAFAYAAVEAAGRPAALSQPNQEVSR